jgi:hypothetical protein
VISQCNPREEDVGEQVDDNGRTPEGDDNMDGEYHILPPDNDTLEFAIKTLPFYLSRADYEPNLVTRAHSLLSQKIGEGMDKLHLEIRLLHEAIDVYLKVSFESFISSFLSTLIGSTDHTCFVEPSPAAVPDAYTEQPTHQFGERVKSDRNAGLM